MYFFRFRRFSYPMWMACCMVGNCDSAIAKSGSKTCLTLCYRLNWSTAPAAFSSLLLPLRKAERNIQRQLGGGSTDVDVVGFSTTGLTSEKPEPSIGHTCVPEITGQVICGLFSKLDFHRLSILFDRTVLWNSLWKSLVWYLCERSELRMLLKGKIPKISFLTPFS